MVKKIWVSRWVKIPFCWSVHLIAQKKKERGGKRRGKGRRNYFKISNHNKKNNPNSLYCSSPILLPPSPLPQSPPQFTSTEILTFLFYFLCRNDVGYVHSSIEFQETINYTS